MIRDHSLDPLSRDVRDEHDVLRDEQRAVPTLERAWVWAIVDGLW